MVSSIYINFIYGMVLPVIWFGLGRIFLWFWKISSSWDISVKHGIIMEHVKNITLSLSAELSA